MSCVAILSLAKWEEAKKEKRGKFPLFEANFVWIDLASLGTFVSIRFVELIAARLQRRMTSRDAASIRKSMIQLYSHQMHNKPRPERT